MALLTRLTDGHQCLWPESAVPGALAEAAQTALRDDQAQNVTLDGEAWFEEALLTGESTPVRKTAGDEVFAGTVCRERPARLRVTCTGAATRPRPPCWPRPGKASATWRGTRASARCSCSPAFHT